MTRRRGTWIKALLRLLRAPLTEANQKFFWGWWAAEGGNGGPYGNINPSPKWNWLCVTRKIIGSTDYNKVGVQNYPNWGMGLYATYKTLTNGRYGDIIRALRSGDPFANRPINGLSIWLTGRSAFRNKIGQDYAFKVLKIGYFWKLHT